MLTVSSQTFIDYETAAMKSIGTRLDAIKAHVCMPQGFENVPILNISW